MNILLTNLSALTPDTQGSPALDATPVGGFAGLLQQQLPATLDGSLQVVEFKTYFPDISGVEMDPGFVPGTVPEADWREYLGQQQIGVSVAAGTPAPAPAEPGATPQHPGEQIPAAAFIGSAPPAADGESLPTGGTPLPDEMTPPPLRRAVAVNIAGPDNPEPLPPTIVVNAAPGPARQVSDPGIAPAAAMAGAEPLAAGQPAAAARQAPLPPALAPEPGRIAADAGAEPVVTRDSSPPPAPAMRMSALAPDAARIAIDPDAPPPPERMIRDSISTGESAAEPRPAMPRDIDGGAENARMTDLRDAFKLPQATQKPVAETVLADATKGRAADLPAPLSIHSAPPAATDVQPLPPGLTTPGVSPSPITQALQGVPLDAMNISRNADPADWGNGLGERVSWMINQKQNSATIRLDPPSLGKLDVHVRVADDATTITIHTQHAQTRDLIETAALRLRDYLQESGYQNVNVDVSQRQDQQHTQPQGGQDALAERDDEFGRDPAPDPVQAAQSGFMNGAGLVDTFA